MILLMGITIFSLICAVLAFIGGGLLAAVLAMIAGWIGGLLLVLLFLVAVCLPVDRETPPENDSKFFRIIAKLYIDMAIRLGRIELRTEGLEKIPREGRFMLVCNHLNELDPAVMLHCFPDSQLAFISKKENKYLPIISQVMHKLMCPLIDRENDREALKTILRCIDMLKQDKVSIGVFPEGYVSLDGRLRHFRGGVFRLIRHCHRTSKKTQAYNQAQAGSQGHPGHREAPFLSPQLGCGGKQFLRQLADGILQLLSVHKYPSRSRCARRASRVRWSSTLALLSVIPQYLAVSFKESM
jgi:1-acyl-sn-glycerol-3-phosphate acyltransferase